MVDPRYELDRTPPEPLLYRKLRWKRRLFRTVGETYIGRRVKLRYFSRMLAQVNVPDGWRIMDAGSGDGVFAFFVAHRFPKATVVGLELNGTEVNVCRRLAEEEGLKNLTFIEGTPETTDKSSFDMVYCLDVLEHISDDALAVRSMRDSLKEGGILILHVPNRYFLETDGRLVTAPDCDAWKINPGHVRQGYTSSELECLLTEAGLKVERTVETQGRPIAYAHHLYARIESSLLLRLLILPIVDLLTLWDYRRGESHGNTVWCIARKASS